MKPLASLTKSRRIEFGEIFHEPCQWINCGYLVPWQRKDSDIRVLWWITDNKLRRWRLWNSKYLYTIQLPNLFDRFGRYFRSFLSRWIERRLLFELQDTRHSTWLPTRRGHKIAGLDISNFTNPSAFPESYPSTPATIQKAQNCVDEPKYKLKSHSRWWVLPIPLVQYLKGDAFAISSSDLGLSSSGVELLIVIWTLSPAEGNINL